MTAFTMRVCGTPAPQGSKRHVGGGRMVESSKAVGPWREAVVAEAIRGGEAGRMLAGPLRVEVMFFLRRPAGHYGTGRNAGRLRHGAPQWPVTRPDVDKTLRSTLDALVQAGVIADDALVVELLGRKRYTHIDRAPGALIQDRGDRPMTGDRGDRPMTGRQQWAIRDRRSGFLHPPRYATRGQAEAQIEELNSPDWPYPSRYGIEPWLDAWPLRGES